MFDMAKRCFFAATLFAILWRRVHGSYNQSYTHNGSAICGFNFYFNGMNCAAALDKKTTTFTAVLSRKTTMFGKSTDTTNTTSDIKTEREIDKKNISATAGYIFISEHFEKILVILAGTVSSLILMMFIAREIYKLLRMSETCSNYQLTMVTPVVNTTSDDTT
ncbi:uncharacterized protein LOC144627373 isoform X3 [Crassostrea virginica]